MSLPQCDALLKTQGYERCKSAGFVKFFGKHRFYPGDYWFCGAHAKLATKNGRIHVTGHGAETLRLLDVGRVLQP